MRTPVVRHEHEPTRGDHLVRQVPDGELACGLLLKADHGHPRRRLVYNRDAPGRLTGRLRRRDRLMQCNRHGASQNG